VSETATDAAPERVALALLVVTEASAPKSPVSNPGMALNVSEKCWEGLLEHPARLHLSLPERSLVGSDMRVGEPLPIVS
jgi:hypothetical protein